MDVRTGFEQPAAPAAPAERRDRITAWRIIREYVDAIRRTDYLDHGLAVYVWVPPATPARVTAAKARLQGEGYTVALADLGEGEPVALGRWRFTVTYPAGPAPPRRV